MALPEAVSTRLGECPRRFWQTLATCNKANLTTLVRRGREAN